MKRTLALWLATLFLLVCSLTFSPFAHADYRFVSFEYPGGINTVPRGINDHGDIVGHYQDGPRVRGFIYSSSDNTFITLDYPGAQVTYLAGINNAGKVVGYYGTRMGNDVWGFVYYNGAFAPISVPDARWTYPQDVNNVGQIVGVCYMPTSYGTWKPQGFVYTEDLLNPSYMTLGFHEASTYLYGINDHGLSVGIFRDGGGVHGLLYENGQFSILDHESIAGDFWIRGETSILGVNNSRQIVGRSGYHLVSPGVIGGEGEFKQGFIYQNGAFEQIGYIGPANNAVVDINNVGEMVGWFDRGFKGFTTLAIGGGEPGGCSQQDLDAAYQQGYQAGLAVGAANPVPGGGGCSTYDFFTGLLNIPCFTMGGENSYWFDLLLAPQGWSIMDYGVN